MSSHFVVRPRFINPVELPKADIEELESEEQNNQDTKLMEEEKENIVDNEGECKTFFQKYKYYIIGAIVTIVIVIIILLCFNYYNPKKELPIENMEESENINIEEMMKLRSMRMQQKQQMQQMQQMQQDSGIIIQQPLETTTVILVDSGLRQEYYEPSSSGKIEELEDEEVQIKHKTIEVKKEEKEEIAKNNINTVINEDKDKDKDKDEDKDKKEEKDKKADIVEEKTEDLEPKNSKKELISNTLDNIVLKEK